MRDPPRLVARHRLRRAIFVLDDQLSHQLWNSAILVRNRTQPGSIHVESTENEPPTTYCGC